MHDSYWQTINLNVTNETILSIKLDAFWNKEYTLKIENTENWPFLVIKIPNVINISYDTVDFSTTIVDTSCVVIEKEEIEKLIRILPQSNIFPKLFYYRLKECNQINKTRFDDVGGGNIEILHDSEISVLLLDEKGNYIDPSLDKVIPFASRFFENKSYDKSFLSKLWKKLK